ncbi:MULTISPECIES: hypothetical protein [unclassified Micromonospora]|uniref:Rv0361 family membrane protein n=1 Tax=unclassified Micromonospora TaxID=2617518 RepID=UPI0033DE2C8B
MAYQQPPVPPKKSKRTLFIVLGVVLALCCSGGVFGGFLLFRVVKDATGPARSAAETFAEAIVDRDYPAAYRQLCTRVRERFSEEEFAQQRASQPEFTGYAITGINVSNNNGLVSGSTTIRFTPEVGNKVTQEFPMVKEDGEWRICE